MRRLYEVVYAFVSLALELSSSYFKTVLTYIWCGALVSFRNQMTNDPIDRLTKDEILDSLVSTQPLIPHLKLLLNRLCKSEVDDVVEERKALLKCMLGLM